jgi:chromate transporter
MTDQDRQAAAPARGSLGEVAAVFLKLGTIGFGGPAAHIALMRDEVVRRRRWVTDQHFLDLLGAANMIPGPNSTEMAIHLGLVRAGWPGLVVGGVCFILPAMLIVLALAWAYATYGATPQAEWLLYGIKPVIIAVVLQALLALGRTAIRGGLLAAVGLGALALYLLGLNELGLLFGGGLVTMLARNAGRVVDARRGSALVVAPLGLLVPGLGQLATSATPFSLATLFFTFLRIGAVLYGSGYVLLAFLRGDFVERLGWLTDQQLLDAVAVGQVTPGPVFTTATFIGYLLGGAPGGVLATVAIFLPGFAFVAATNPLIPRVRASSWAGAALDGVNAAALGLMAAVTLELGRAAVVDAPTAVLAILAAGLLVRFKVNSAWLVAGGGVVGVATRLLGAG